MNLNSLALQAELRERVRGEVRFDAGTRAVYVYGSSNYCQVPFGVVIPKDEEALNRGLQLAEECMRKAPERRWKKAREEVREAIEREGYDDERGVFIQTFGGEELNAALLLLPKVEFVDYGDERMVRTTDAVREELDDDGLLKRYRSEEEGPFLACSFWLIECLARQGRIDEAQATYDRTLSTNNDLGLFSEMYDTENGEMLGNFPQGLTTSPTSPPSP